ncbi:MAG: hypothetical protein QG618_634 [Thermodesulfobacteriota bacterium]|nr:hypothetical protein [Thermodesulfobacteriota bacterium]
MFDQRLLLVWVSPDLIYDIINIIRIATNMPEVSIAGNKGARFFIHVQKIVRHSGLYPWAFR